MDDDWNGEDMNLGILWADEAWIGTIWVNSQHVLVDINILRDLNLFGNAWIQGDLNVDGTIIGDKFKSVDANSVYGASTAALGKDTTAFGNYSFAAGEGSTASGGWSVAVGEAAIASGDYSMAAGSYSEASGTASFATGSTAIASGFGSTAIGNSPISSGVGSTAIGRNATASNESSIALGYQPIAVGKGAIAAGYGVSYGNIRAVGDGAIAMGYSDTNMVAGNASTDYGAIALGYNVQSLGEASIALGKDINCYVDNQVCVQDLNVLGDSNFTNVGVSENVWVDGNITTAGTVAIGSSALAYSVPFLVESGTSGIQSTAFVADKFSSDTDNANYIDASGDPWVLNSAALQADSFNLLDNRYLLLGDAGDGRIDYDAVNLIIDPDAVGTGSVFIGATADDDLNANNLSLGGTLWTGSIDSYGDLKIMPDVQGDVHVFGDTDVANDAAGKSFSIWRKAAEGDVKFEFTINAAKQAVFDTDGGVFYVRSTTNRLSLQNSAADNVRVFENSTDGENKNFRVYGYPTGESLKYGQFQVSSNPTAFQISTDANNVEIAGDINATGDSNFASLEVGGNLWVDGNIHHNGVFGELYIAEGSFAQILETQNAWYEVDFAQGGTNGLSSGVIANKDANNMTIQHTGTYMVIVSANWSTTGGADIFELHMTKNNGATLFENIEAHRKMSAGGDVGSTSASGLVALTAGDTIELYVRSITDSDDTITFIDLDFSILKIGN